MARRDKDRCATIQVGIKSPQGSKKSKSKEENCDAMRHRKCQPKASSALYNTRLDVASPATSEAATATAAKWGRTPLLAPLAVPPWIMA